MAFSYILYPFFSSFSSLLSIYLYSLSSLLYLSPLSSLLSPLPFSSLLSIFSASLLSMLSLYFSLFLSFFSLSLFFLRLFFLHSSCLLSYFSSGIFSHFGCLRSPLFSDLSLPLPPSSCIDLSFSPCDFYLYSRTSTHSASHAAPCRSMLGGGTTKGCWDTDSNLSSSNCSDMSGLSTCIPDKNKIPYSLIRTVHKCRESYLMRILILILTQVAFKTCCFCTPTLL